MDVPIERRASVRHTPVDKEAPGFRIDLVGGQITQGRRLNISQDGADEGVLRDAGIRVRTDHERIGPLLASHGRAWSLKAAAQEEAAEQARDTKEAEMEAHRGAPAAARKRMEAMHDRLIHDHETLARIYRRRSEYALTGYVRDGPAERRDVEYQCRHHELIAMARRTNRLCFLADELPVD